MALSPAAITQLKNNGADVVFIKTKWETLATSSAVGTAFVTAARDALLADVDNIIAAGLKPTVCLEFNGSYTTTGGTVNWPASASYGRAGALTLEMWQGFVEKLASTLRTRPTCNLALAGADTIPDVTGYTGFDIWRAWSREFGMVARETNFEGEIFLSGYHKGAPGVWSENPKGWFFDQLPHDRTTYYARHVLDPTNAWNAPTAGDSSRVTTEAKVFCDWLKTNKSRGLVEIKADASWSAELNAALAFYQYNDVQVVIGGVSQAASAAKGMALYGSNLASTTTVASTANTYKQALKPKKTFVPPGTYKSAHYPQKYVPNHILQAIVPANAPAAANSAAILANLDAMNIPLQSKTTAFTYGNKFTMPVIVYYDDDPDVRDVWVDIKSFNSGAAGAPGAFSPNPAGHGPMLGGPFRLPGRAVACKPWRDMVRDTSLTFIRLNRATGLPIDIHAFWHFDWETADRTKASASWAGLMDDPATNKTLQFQVGSTTASGLDTSQLVTSVTEMEALARGDIAYFDHALAFATYDSLKGHVYPAQQDDGEYLSGDYAKEGQLIVSTETDAQIDARNEPLLVRAMRKTVARHGVFACDKTRWNIGWQLEPSYQWNLYNPGQKDYNDPTGSVYQTIFGTGSWWDHFDSWIWASQGFKVVDEAWQDTYYKAL